MAKCSYSISIGTIFGSTVGPLESHDSWVKDPVLHATNSTPWYGQPYRSAIVNDIAGYINLRPGGILKEKRPTVYGGGCFRGREVGICLGKVKSPQ